MSFNTINCKNCANKKSCDHYKAHCDPIGGDWIRQDGDCNNYKENPFAVKTSRNGDSFADPSFGKSHLVADDSHHTWQKPHIETSTNTPVAVYTGKNGESRFEDDFCKVLQMAGWSDILWYPTAKDLEDNWRKIIFENNKAALHNVPISDSEMQEICSIVYLKARNPVGAYDVISGKHIIFKRDSDSPDKDGAGKEIDIELFNPAEIAGGNTKYQIARQPVFKTGKQYNDRRGDVLLLINGMPVIHIELKASGVPVIQAANQIQKYAYEGIFKNSIMSLVQVFFAVTPEDHLYFANPGEWDKFNPTFFFHWADEDGIQISHWKDLITGPYHILSVPEAHHLIGYYTVADRGRGVLKVARSYQYHAVRKIVFRTRAQVWGNIDQLGGYVWCTTGGGKTLSSFKAGQIIIEQLYADKVVFVVDRIELNTQSTEEYRSFARDGQDVQSAENTYDLFRMLCNDNFADKLIITSIQKLNKVKEKFEESQKAQDIISDKRIVFIIDEAQRSQFGTMHAAMKSVFQQALFFGFTGTPIFLENNKFGLTTDQIFGPCLSAYSIAQGIKDENVLGFNPIFVRTYDPKELKKEIALNQAKCKTEEEALSDENKNRIYRDIMSRPMVKKSAKDKDGIEDLLPSHQYNNSKHRMAVVKDIIDNWNIFSRGPKGTRFHALLSTNSIEEAIEYYHLFKKMSELKVFALFDPNIDNSGTRAISKEKDLIEIVEDYNKTYGRAFDRTVDPQLKALKTDIINRLSHKKDLRNIDKEPSQQIDILIVVDQLLTGFDSMWVNTLYLDRELDTDRLIQAMSRTNRIFDKLEKPFGIIRFYRKPATMEKNLEEALKLYCEGDNNVVLASNLEANITIIKRSFDFINRIFNSNAISNFNSLPKSDEDRNKFKREFITLRLSLRAAELQGLSWTNEHGQKLPFDKQTYDILSRRYEDVVTHRVNIGIRGTGFDLETKISEIEGERIDDEYLEAKFRTLILSIQSLDEIAASAKIAEFDKELAILSEKDQIIARQIIQDIKNKKIGLDVYKTLHEYIAEYKKTERTNMLNEWHDRFGIDVKVLDDFLAKTTNKKEFDDNVNAVISTCPPEKIQGLKARREVWTALHDFIFG